MIRILSALALLCLPLSASAQSDSAPMADPPEISLAISLDQRMLLRCSAAFALVANRQHGGQGWALEYPPLEERGREFFVVASARVIDQAQLTDEQIEALLRAEAAELLDQEVLTSIMPVCLGLLDQSGL